ncbi:hypothetical protein L873DRAFT_1327993 [Choiromyces venosus 120613-1]|uniref:Uncharacterized protein n=1 Tax=Choiromyces venosus 120613-1 TaxID=1336337 RepID=A0A3N4JNA8_9PEZI|nr:hypothetical protein L873DRAFT_1327993 [Choiromyces venosus 120613-1]
MVPVAINLYMRPFLSLIIKQDLGIFTHFLLILWGILGFFSRFLLLQEFRSSKNSSGMTKIREPYLKSKNNFAKLGLVQCLTSENLCLHLFLLTFCRRPLLEVFSQNAPT